MQQHGRADADGIALHGGNQRLAGLADGFDEAMSGAVAGALAAGLACEVRQIVAGRKAVAVALAQHDADGRIRLRLLEAVGQRVIHGARQRVLLLRALQRQRHDAASDLGLDVFGHGVLPQATARAGGFTSTPSRKPVKRWRMICSASNMMRSISSFTVGTSLIRPTTMPQLQAPASMSPSTITFG